MQRLLTIANSDYLGKDTAFTSFAGQVISGMAWIRPAAVNVTQVIWFIGDKDVAATYYLVQVSSAGIPGLVSRLGGGTQTNVNWGSAITANVHHLVAWKISASEGSLSISVDGGAWVTATTTNTGIWAVSDRINWGRAGDSTPGFHYGGGLGPGGLWRGLDISIEQVQAVWRGLSIARVPPQYRNGLWTFRTEGLAYEPDYSSIGLSLTPSGDIPASANGPPVGTARRDISFAWARPSYTPPSPPPPPVPPGEVQIKSVSAIVGKRNGADRTSPLTFDAVGVAAGSTVMVMQVWLQPETSAATITSVEWGGLTLERGAPDHYLGDASAVSCTVWYLVSPPTGDALVPKITTAGPTWSGAIRLWGLAGVDTNSVVRSGGVSQNVRTTSLPTSPAVTLNGSKGELLLFSSGFQGSDGGTVAINWPGADNVVQGASTGSSLTTDISVASAGKLLTADGSEAPVATWAASDSQGAGLFAVKPIPLGLPFDPYDLIANMNYKWPSLTITFGFPELGHVWIGEQNTVVYSNGVVINFESGFIPLHAAGRAAVRSIMAYFSTLGFNMVETSSDPEVTFAISPGVSNIPGGANAVTNYPTTGNEGNTWLRLDSAAEAANLSFYYGNGGRRRLTILHEICHTFGLRHTTTSLANRTNSVMAVDPPIENTGREPYVTTPYPADLAALKLLYPTLVIPELPPIASFTVSATSGPRPFAATFTDTSIGAGIYAWAWNFGDGSASGLRNPTKTWSNAGIYAVTLVVTSPKGSSQIASTTITVTQSSSTITCFTDVISGLDQGDTTTINVVANDTGTGLSVVSVAGADKCTASVISTTTIQVTAFSTATGSDRLTYTVQDANGQQATGTLDVYFTGTTPPPTSSAEFDIAYRYIGYTGFGGSQGNVHQAGGQWWRFLAARSGTLDQFLMFTQGARPNYEYADEHAKWNYGEYTITVYLYTGPAGGSLPQGNVGSSLYRTLLGGTKGKFYPARPRPTSARSTVFNPVAPTNTKPGNLGGVHSQEGSSDGTFTSDVDGEIGGWHQSYNTLKDAVKGDTTWNATNRYGGTGWIVVEVGRTVGSNWASGILVNKGDILLVEYKNNTPSAGHTMSNDVHMVYGPVTRPDLGLRVPGDPVRAVFGADQNRDWRKTPCYAMRIGGLWYGDAVTLTHSTTNGLGTTAPRKDVRKITRGQWVRQVITMPSDFEGETVNEICVWAWKLTSPNGSDASGDLEVAVWRAPYTAAGSPAFTDVTGWVTIPQGDFGALGDHPHSRNGLGNVKATSLSQIMRYGFATIADLDVTKDYHYAIVARASFGSAVYATSSMISAANRLNRTTTASSVRMDAEGVFPRLPCWGASDVINGRRFNVAQYSPDQGSSWLPQDTASGAAGIVWPFSLKPKS